MEMFSKKTNDCATEVYVNLTNILDSKQLTTLLNFYADESKYENIVLESISSQLLGDVSTKAYSEGVALELTTAEKIIDLLRNIE